MKHSSFFQWKLKNVTLLFIIGILLAGLGFSDVNNSITTYYIYKDKPMNLNLRADKIFIKMKQVLTKDELKTTLSQYSQISFTDKFDAKEKMQFIDETGNYTPFPAHQSGECCSSNIHRIHSKFVNHGTD